MARTTAQKLAAVSFFLILFLKISGAAVSLGYAMSMGLLSTFPSQGELARYLPFNSELARYLVLNATLARYRATK